MYYTSSEYGEKAYKAGQQVIRLAQDLEWEILRDAKTGQASGLVDDAISAMCEDSFALPILNLISNQVTDAELGRAVREAAMAIIASVALSQAERGL